MKRLQFSLLLLAFSITLINCKNETKEQEANETEKTPAAADGQHQKLENYEGRC